MIYKHFRFMDKVEIVTDLEYLNKFSLRKTTLNVR